MCVCVYPISKASVLFVAIRAGKKEQQTENTRRNAHVYGLFIFPVFYVCKFIDIRLYAYKYDDIEEK